MQYRLRNNELFILDDKGNIIENATKNQNECKYCEFWKDNMCSKMRNDQLYGGRRCDGMRCIFKDGDK